MIWFIQAFCSRGKLGEIFSADNEQDLYGFQFETFVQLQVLISMWNRVRIINAVAFGAVECKFHLLFISTNLDVLILTNYSGFGFVAEASAIHYIFNRLYRDNFVYMV